MELGDEEDAPTLAQASGEDPVEPVPDRAAGARRAFAQAAEALEVAAVADAGGEERLEDLRELCPLFGAERGQGFGDRRAARGEHPLQPLATGVGQRELQAAPPGLLAALYPARSHQPLHEAGGSRLGEPEGPAEILDRPAGRGGDDDERRRRGAGLPDDRGGGGLLRVRDLERERPEEVREPIGVYGRSGSACMTHAS